MKQSYTTSSFRYEERGHGKVSTHAGGGRRGTTRTGCQLRRARRSTAATGYGDAFVHSKMKSRLTAPPLHLFFSVCMKSAAAASRDTRGRKTAGGRRGRGVHCVGRGGGRRRERGGHIQHHEKYAFFKIHNGKKWPCVIKRPLPTNGGSKSIVQCIPWGNGIEPRFPRPRGK